MTEGNPLTPEEAADKVWRALTQWDPRAALTPAVVHVHHDTEAHVRSFNEGYEAAVSQGLADDPMLASDWLDGKLREARAEALEEAALAFEISPHNSRAKMARHFNNAYVKKLRERAAVERSDG
jgi:hypothetical protein